MVSGSLFTLLFGVLFTFPSQYWFTIGLSGVFSLTGWCRQIQTGRLRPRPTQDTTSPLRLPLRGSQVLSCFSSPGSLPPSGGYHAFGMVGCPIRTPTDQALFAGPRSFSQLTTSFFASESLGIPHTPFSTSSNLIFKNSTNWRPCGLSCYLLLSFLRQHVNELFTSI